MATVKIGPKYILAWDLIEALKIILLLSFIIGICVGCFMMHSYFEEYNDIQRNCSFTNQSYLSKSAQCNLIQDDLWLCGELRKPIER